MATHGKLFDGGMLGFSQLPGVPNTAEGLMMTIVMVMMMMVVAVMLKYGCAVDANDEEGQAAGQVRMAIMMATMAVLAEGDNDDSGNHI